PRESSLRFSSSFSASAERLFAIFNLIILNRSSRQFHTRPNRRETFSDLRLSGRKTTSAHYPPRQNPWSTAWHFCIMYSSRDNWLRSFEYSINPDRSKLLDISRAIPSL